MAVRRFLIPIATVLAVFIVLICSVSCGGVAGGDFVVYITLDGTQYELSGGYDGNDVDPGANGCRRSGSETRIAGVGGDVTTASSSCKGPLLLLNIDGSSPGTYGGSMWFYTGSESISVNSDVGGDIAVVITQFPDSVGGTIRGTFSGTKDAQTFSGTFSVERLEYDSITPPGYFS